MSEKTRVYFAAPLFTQAEWQWNQRIADELIALGFNVVLPQKRAEPMLNSVESFNAPLLFKANVSEIDKADVVLAVFDQPDPDSGTCWECGYAYKAGVPIVGLRTDLRCAGDDPNAAVNLMLSQSCKELVILPLDKRDDLLYVAQSVAESLSRVFNRETGSVEIS